MLCGSCAAITRSASTFSGSVSSVITRRPILACIKGCVTSEVVVFAAAVIRAPIYQVGLLTGFNKRKRVAVLCLMSVTPRGNAGTPPLPRSGGSFKIADTKALVFNAPLVGVWVITLVGAAASGTCAYHDSCGCVIINGSRLLVRTPRPVSHGYVKKELCSRHLKN